MNQIRDRIDPGIVVLSSSLQCLHINQQAVALLTQLGRSASRVGADRNLTAPLHPLCHDIIRTMQERLASRDFEPFHRYHVIGDSAQEILLKGFGLPDQRGLPQSRIVLLLSPRLPAAQP